MNRPRTMLNPDVPLDLLRGALAAYPDAVAVLPIFAPAAPDETLVLSAKIRTRRLPPDLAAKLAAEDAGATGNGTRPALPTHITVGRLLLTVPADIAENLCGPAAERHPMCLVIVHRDVYNEAMRQARSGIVLAGPGAMPPGVPPVGGGGRIVKP